MNLKRLFFKDGSSISVADLRGLYRYTIFKGEPLREPRAIVLDPMERFIFILKKNFLHLHLSISLISSFLVFY